MTRSKLAALYVPLSVSILIAASCADDGSLDDLIAEMESQTDESPSDPVDAAGDEEPADTAGTDEPTDAADEPDTPEPTESAALSDDEQAVILVLSQGAPVPAAEARCLADGMAAQGVDPNDVIGEALTIEDDALVTDLILTCFENPENLQGFVQNFATGFSLTAGFELTTDEAACLVAALGDGNYTVADLDGSELPPGLQEDMNACIGPGGGAFEPGDAYGDNPILDLLWDECTEGTMLSCDELYGISEIASGYETFGATCGGREPEAAGGTCDAPYSYGDNAQLDTFWDACDAGDGAACDQLYFDSPIGSVYEDFGDTCGYRYDESPGFCEDALG